MKRACQINRLISKEAKQINGPTPGDWEAVPVSGRRRVYIRRKDAPVGEMAICEIMTGRRWEESQANAKLIRSAPNLLRACQAAMPIVATMCKTLAETCTNEDVEALQLLDLAINRASN